MLLFQCHISCNGTKQMLVHHSQVKYPVVEINVSNLLLSVVLEKKEKKPWLLI